MVFVGTSVNEEVYWLVTAHQHLMLAGVSDVEMWEADQVLLCAQGARVS